MACYAAALNVGWLAYLCELCALHFTRGSLDIYKIASPNRTKGPTSERPQNTIRNSDIKLYSMAHRNGAFLQETEDIGPARRAATQLGL